MPRKLTKDEFIEKAIQVHKDKYNFNESVYEGSQTKIKIYCNSCKDYFYTTPNVILSGKGCKKCADNSITKTNEIFKDECDKLYSNKFSLLSEYKGNRNKVQVKCNTHNKEFNILACSLLQGKAGCEDCECSNGKKRKVTTDEFISDITSNSKFEKYDFSKFIYVNSRTKGIVICDKGHEFLSNPSSLKSGRGCQLCGLNITTSKGMFDIIDILNSHKISHTREKKFEDCVDTNQLPFDLYLDEYNICIEYDGKQHFEIMEHWGGEKEFNTRVKHDQLKNEYCKMNNIKLYRIRYDEDHVEKINRIIKDLK